MSTTTKPQRIQLSRKKGYRKPDGAVVVSRPGKFGNPFPIGKPGPMGRTAPDALGAVGFFRAMLRDPQLRAAAGYPTDDEIRRELRGRDLLCWCPLGSACHADALIAVANAGSNP